VVKHKLRETDRYTDRERRETTKQTQLMLTNPRNAFRGQSTSPNMVPFDRLGMVSVL